MRARLFSMSATRRILAGTAISKAIRFLAIGLAIATEFQRSPAAGLGDGTPQ